MIKISNLNKFYNKNRRNENHVINNISYEFGETGLYTFFGESGCGKTTLLNVLGGLDTFDSGTISFENVSFNKYVSKDFDLIRNKLVGYIFQNYNLIDTKTVQENIELVLDIIGIVDKDERKKRTVEVLTAVGLYKKRKRNVLSLSGGERQRVAIARALAKSPKVILADEPTGNLDSNNTFDVMNIIKKISKTRLVILVSHERDLVEFYSDKIIELKDGVIVKERENSGATLDKTDTRNIYLKDYNTEQVDNDLVTINFYKNNDSEKINFDIVLRNGEYYIKANSANKIHFVEEQSEIKFLDKSEKEFIESRREVEADFALEDFDNSKEDKSKKKTIFGYILSSFKARTLLKKSVFTVIALISISFIYTILFMNLASILSFNKNQYNIVSENSVLVEIKNKEKRDGHDAIELSNLVNNIDSNAEILSKELTHSLSIDVSTFYQSNSNESIDVFLEKYDTLNEKIIEGRTIENSKEVIISSYLIDQMFDKHLVKANGIDRYSDFLNRDCTLCISSRAALLSSFYLPREYKEEKGYKIVGIIESDNPIALVRDEDYIDYPVASDNQSFIIYTKEKDKMIDELSNTFSNVKDAKTYIKSDFIKETIKSKKSTLIGIFAILAVIFVYLFFMIRSSLFNKIKEIGVLRSVGAMKKDVKKILIGDIFVMTTKSSAITYLIIYLIAFIYSSNFSLASLGFKLFGFNIIWFIVGLALLYLVNILSGILPISMLLNKTPVEIIKKYDI